MTAERKDGPTISIAMATYNGARYLREQLDSLAAQTYLPCELVVGDDGSTDETLAILEEFAAEAPFPVRIHRNPENLGWRDNFLQTALRCEGEWVAFCDQDDVWLPEKLLRCMEIAAAHPSVVHIGHRLRQMDHTLTRDLGVIPKGRSSKLFRRLEGNGLSVWPGCATVFRRSIIIKEVIGFRPIDLICDVKQSHDQHVYMMSFVLGDRYVLGDVLSCYRRHEAACSGVGDKIYREGIIDKIWTAMMGSSNRGHTRMAYVARMYVDFFNRLNILMNSIIHDDVLYRYKKIESSYTKRSVLYASNSASHRLNIFYRILLDGLYSFALLGRKTAVIRDFVFVIFGK